MKPATRRYTQRFVPTMLAYVVAVLAVTTTFQHHAVHGVFAWLIAVVPAIPIVGVVVIVGLYLHEEPDEFEKVILTQAMLWAVGATLSLFTVWGFLQLYLHVRQVDGVLIFPAFCAFAGLASGIVRWRYR